MYLPCLKSLKDGSFVDQTFAKNKLEYPALRSIDEVLLNATFRYLQVRGYIDDSHRPTTWGKAMETALSIADDEAIVTGIEMLRLGLFTGNFATGTPVSKTGMSLTWYWLCSKLIPIPDKDYDRKVFTNLISKTACLGRLRHKPMGFVGPLDRQLLTFAWKITAVRRSIRDLLETVVTGMFLGGEVERERDDWTHLVEKYGSFQ
jgi:hypothetical protein